MTTQATQCTFLSDEVACFRRRGKKQQQPQQQQKQQQPVVTANVNVSSFPPLTYQLKRILYLKATYVLKHPLAFKLDSHSNLNHFGKHNPPHILCALRKTYAVAGPGSILTFHFLVFIYCFIAIAPYGIREGARKLDTSVDPQEESDNG